MTSEVSNTTTVIDHLSATDFESNWNWNFADFPSISHYHSLNKHPHQLIIRQSTIISTHWSLLA